MFKVIIIDDEPVIRKGLKNVINWDTMDCKVIAEAGDGQRGCQLIRDFLPDIIITDIRMPEMDGLEMIKSIKGIVPQSKIVIVTGHRDFDYVHESLKLGAFDYVLKPTKIEELTSIVRRAVTELKLNKQRKAEYSRFKELFENSLPILREKFLYDILNEIVIDTNDINQKKDVYKIPFQQFVLVLVDFTNTGSKGESAQNEGYLHRYGIENTFKELWEGTNKVIEINLSDNIIAFMVECFSISDIKPTIKKCADLQQIINTCFDLEATIAVSTMACDLTELSSKYCQCLDALERKFYIGENSIIYFDDLDQFIRFNDNRDLEKLHKKLLQDIQTGNRARVEVDLQEISRTIKDNSGHDEEYLKNYFFQIISSINSIRNSLKHTGDKDNSDIASLYSLIQKCESIHDLEEILQRAAMDLTDRIHLHNSDSIKQSVRMAVGYIEQNYNRQITLSEVADNVFLSTYYLSRMFKKELGKSFVDYLNEYRIEQSKRLLKETQYKAYEVAELVGISDGHYFSRLFKKHEGMTPTEYREIG